MNKLLIICGPTATGKTSLGLMFAQKYGGDLISADSRQVYRGLDIGTGKDVPAEFSVQFPEDMNKHCYSDGKTNIWGLDLVSPHEEFSTAHYYRYVRKKIKEIWDCSKLPILVGGTGLYINTVIQGIDTAEVAPNQNLRDSLEKRPVDELFTVLLRKDDQKARKLNDSDKKNKRRLIRAIEIASSPQNKKTGERLDADILKIGLYLPRDEIKARIKTRVIERINNGFESEVQRLISDEVSWGSQAMQSTGYRQYKRYLDGEVNFEEFKDDWVRAEYRYAKRQLTWFRSDSEVKWFEVNRDQKKLADLVEKWYSSTRYNG